MEILRHRLKVLLRNTRIRRVRNEATRRDDPRRLDRRKFTVDGEALDLKRLGYVEVAIMTREWAPEWLGTHEKATGDF